jgi:hypothetical protein
MSIGVTKDYKLKVKNLHASHTLGWSWNWNTYLKDRAEVNKRELCECDG